MLLQKIKIREIPKLRRSAKNAPYCFSCHKANDGTLVLAHSNQLRLGRGSFHKTPDYYGAIVCFACHDLMDGRDIRLTKEEKREMHQKAHELTLMWWTEAGFVKWG